MLIRGSDFYSIYKHFLSEPDEDEDEESYVHPFQPPKGKLIPNRAVNHAVSRRFWLLHEVVHLVAPAPMPLPNHSQLQQSQI